jgi:hypothetical protein
MWSQHTASQVQMLVGMVKEKIVFKAQMDKKGLTMIKTMTKRPIRARV